MSKEKKLGNKVLGVTSYVKSGQEKLSSDSSIYARVTYQRKKIEIKSPTSIVLGKKISKVSLSALSQNDSRIINNAKKFMDSKDFQFDLKLFKDESIKTLLGPIDILNYKHTANMMMDYFEKAKMPYAAFLVSDLGDDETLIDSFIMALEELSPSIHNDMCEEINFVHGQFDQIIQTYLDENECIYCSIADFLVDEGISEIVSSIGFREMEEYIAQIKRSVVPDKFLRTINVTL